MEQFFLNFCVAIQINSAACNSALLGVYTNSNVQKEYNLSKNYSEGRIKYYIDENKTIVYTGTALATGYDMYQKKEIKVSAPFKPICDSLNVDLKSDNDDSFRMDWKWEF